MSESKKNPENSPSPPEPQSVNGWRVLLTGRNPKTTLIRAGVLAAVCFVVFSFILLPAKVTGVSMEPTYRNGGVNLINRLAYVFSEPERGDVVGVKLTGNNIQFLKRVIALPGETFAIREGVVYIDGQALAEPYTTPNVTWTTKTETVLEPGKYVVIGDNRSMDIDLHTWGAIRFERIVGKALF